MKLGRLRQGLVVAAAAATAATLALPATALAAPVAPPAYTVFAAAQPVYWAGSSNPPVVDLRVPFVQGSTNNLAVAVSDAVLALPDHTTTTMSGESIKGLTCTGFEDGQCTDPFLPQAKVDHTGPDRAHLERSASFTGKDGKFPGALHALTDCPGSCGEQLVRSLSDASGPAGGLSGYLTVGGSSASHELSIDDKGRLVGTARSQLDNVSIGPKSEVRFSTLVATAQAVGDAAENTKEGRSDLHIGGFVILDNAVELTRAGLRLANGAPSEQEAYAGAKVLLEKLKERGIVLELPNFDAQVARQPDHVTVDSYGLKVRFEQSVPGGPVQASTLSHPLELGHSTAVVAVDRERNIDVKVNTRGEVVVQDGPKLDAAAPGAVDPRGPSAAPPTVSSPRPPTGQGTPVRPPADARLTDPTDDPASTTTGADSNAGAAVDPGAGGSLDPSTSGGSSGPLTDPNERALSADAAARKLGLRGAHSVSRAFGAFLGLGLILPLARLVIRRLG